MSSSGTRMDRVEALRAAKRFIAMIEPYTDQIIIAGSLRRRLPTIGDIEIVAVPKIGVMEIQTLKLFGSEIERRDVDLLDGVMTRILESGAISKRLDMNGAPRWGPALKYLDYEGVRVDLFTCGADRLGWITMLRTGPAEFSRQLVVPRDRLTKDARYGLMPPYIAAKDGWLTYRTSGESIATPTEQSVFDLFGLIYREPWERS